MTTSAASHVQRASTLMGQGRADLAERELRAGLGQEPDHPLAHALLSLCLTDLRRADEATREADEAIRLAPDASLAHYARAAALLSAERPAEARASVERAIALDPDDADAVALLGQVHLDERRWQDALAAAERGLALDPTHVASTNVRALALTKLRRHDVAADVLAGALARDPENARTHTNVGLACLHRGAIDEATEHFREALRLEPDFEPARQGLLETLRARHGLYRQVLRFFLWMGTLSANAGTLVVLGVLIVPRVLRYVAREVPALEPVVIPVVVLVAAFVYLTWTAEHLFNVALLFHPFGRMVLTARERRGALAVTGCLAAALVGFGLGAAGWKLEKHSVAVLGLMALVYVIPLSAYFRADSPRARRILGGAASVLALAALGAAVVLAGVVPEGWPAASLVGAVCLLLFFGGVFVVSLVANGITFRRARLA